jgi:hypothetical protein
MSSTDRQNRLLAAEDWKKVYQSFRNADFKSYDFDNLRRTMIEYLRNNYPEDFNDYIESSEYLALIDMIAFLGQNIAFRVDLNARENYIELAERRESVLRLARLVSYNPKRNLAANGLLKIESVSTTETVQDSNGVNLRNQTIVWNDPANPNWNEHFEKVINAALPVNGKIGNPVKQSNISGVPTQKYKLNAGNTGIPVYGYSKTVDGRSLDFEIVSTDITDDLIQEEAPFPGNNLGFIFRDDGQGPASSNTGYFVHFRQGTLNFGDFTVDNPSANQTIAVDSVNTNNTDVWLYNVDDLGEEQELWTRVDSIEGNNVIYNSLVKTERNIYSVLTRVEDRINLVFADGTFGNIPSGPFRVYYRTSANRPSNITPSDMRNVSVSIPYISRNGKSENITFTFALQYVVDNASRSESNESIRTNAPATYYTQNRLVTAEDYQIGPLAVSQEIVKSKSVNRTSSGISRNFDLIDATGKYSSTNIFSADGILYKEFINEAKTFTFENLTDVQGEILNTVEPTVQGKRLRDFYLDRYPRVIVEDLGNVWLQNTADTNQSTGYFENSVDIAAKLSSFTQNNMRFVREGALLKFRAPEGLHFLNGELVSSEPDFRGGTRTVWSKVIRIIDDGTEVQEDGTGPVVLSDQIPSDAQLTEIITALPNSLTSEVTAQATDQIFAGRTFGLRYDREIDEWRIVTENNLDVQSEFSTGKTGDVTGQQLDASWLLLFETDGVRYNLTLRGLRYVFESSEEVRFYFDSANTIFDAETGRVIKDKITVLDINTRPDSTEPFNRGFDWEITNEFRDLAGYVNSKKVEVSFFDSDADGIVDNPEQFLGLVDDANLSQDNIERKLVFLERQNSQDGIVDFEYVTQDEIDVRVFLRKGQEGALSQYPDGQLFYFLREDIFERLNLQTASLRLDPNYRAEIGRDSLRFQYVHAADDNSRIDPSASNIIDTYLLTRGYDRQFRLWLDGTRNDKPLPPSSDSLYVSYGENLNKIKSLSDEIIYHPVKYKVLFGNKADPELQAQFKIVKNPDLVINENELKSRTIDAINRFFALENWEFGDRFFFSELAGYVINELTPDLVTFVLVPVQGDQSFGSLYEIKSEADEIFISAATVDNIDIIDEITEARLRAEGKVITRSMEENTGITSSSMITQTSGVYNTTSTSIPSNTTTSSPAQTTVSDNNTGSTYTPPSTSGSTGGSTSGGGYSY